MNKKVVSSIVNSILLMISIMFIVGCLDYKAYEAPAETDDVDLINEIAAIEEELGLDAEDQPNQTVTEDQAITEEVTLDLDEPSYSEEPQLIEINENEWVRLKANIVDPDNDKVTYSFTPPLNNNGEWKTNYGDEGEYLVTLAATDGVLTTEKVLKIIVKRVNVPPVIEGVFDLNFKEGETINFQPKVTDPNNDPVELKISEPLSNGVFVTDHTSAGDYQITIVASDGELQAEKSLTLKIANVNELPQISNVEDVVVKEGEVIKLEPVVSDLDGDEIVVTISEPFGDDGVWETSFTSHGSYPVTITANDGQDTVTKKVQITVEDVNMPPEIIEVYLAVN